jgi:hypothetical protein
LVRFKSVIDRRIRVLIPEEDRELLLEVLPVVSREVSQDVVDGEVVKG